MKCASHLAAALRRPVELVFPPPTYKDIRCITQVNGEILK